MKRGNRAAAVVLATVLSTVLAAPASAETVLRLDEVSVGELDPGKASDYVDSILMFNVYDTLILPRQGGPGHVPHLAESWEVDGNAYTFVLRSDVTFQSGNPLTAEDVVFSFERMSALGAGLSYLFGDVESVEALSGDTVRFNLSQPSAPFVASLVRLPIVDKALVMENLADGDYGDMRDWGQTFLSGNGAGTGAYEVVDHNPLQETVLVKNEDYFLGIPDKAPDTVRVRYDLEAATVRTLMTQGEHDISSQWLPPEVMRAMAGESGVRLLTDAGGSAFYVKMNTTKPPLDDVNCRLALSRAFDYSAVVQMIAVTPEISQGRAATGAVPVGMFGSNPPDQVLTQDMDAAKAHLADCQYDPADYTLDLSWIATVPLEERFALLMQSNFTELGFESEIRKLPWTLFTELVSKSEDAPNISQVFVASTTGDPDTLLYGQYHSSAAGTWQSAEHLNDPEVDRLLEAGRTAANDEEREAAYASLNARLMEIAPSIYGYDVQSVFAVSERVDIPVMTDPSQNFGLHGMSFTFRLIEMNE